MREYPALPSFGGKINGVGLEHETLLKSISDNRGEGSSPATAADAAEQRRESAKSGVFAMQEWSEGETSTVAVHSRELALQPQQRGPHSSWYAAIEPVTCFLTSPYGPVNSYNLR